MTDERTPSEEHVDAITRKNAEESRKLIESRKHRSQRATPQTDELRPRGSVEEEQRQQAPPGQTDVPVGGTTGPNAAGGSSKRHKPD